MLLEPEISRARIVATAREWLGTPYIHQASLKGIGCDCLGLLRGVWQEVYNVETEAPPPYTPSWAESGTSGQEPMLEAATKYMTAKPFESMQPGDVVLIRVFPKSAIKHCCIVSYDNHIIHAYDHHVVVEEPMRVNWKRRQVYVFEMPGVTD